MNSLRWGTSSRLEGGMTAKWIWGLWATLIFSLFPVTLSTQCVSLNRSNGNGGGFWEGGRVGSTGSLSPNLDTNCTGRTSDVLSPWNSGACWSPATPREAGMVNWRQVQLLAQQQPPTHCLQPRQGPLQFCCSRWSQPAGARVGEKDCPLHTGGQFSAASDH